MAAEFAQCSHKKGIILSHDQGDNSSLAAYFPPGDREKNGVFLWDQETAAAVPTRTVGA